MGKINNIIVEQISDSYMYVHNAIYKIKIFDQKP